LGETLKQVAFQKTEPEAAALVSERKVRRWAVSENQEALGRPSEASAAPAATF